MATFGYDNLFAYRRVIVFSLPQFFTLCAGRQLRSYKDQYEQLRAHGIDDVCAIDSTNWLIGPHIDKRSDTIKGLPDRGMKFIEALAAHYNYQKPVTELARLWQYVVLINNGEPEKIWSNPFKENIPLSVLKDPQYRFRKLSADIILKYLIDNPQ